MAKVNFINKKNLIIARNNIGLTTQNASRKITNSGKDLVLSWEKGNALPTWRQAEILAKAYDIPELAFFSEKIIKKNKTIPDYRVKDEVGDSDKIKKLINLIISRQKWLEPRLKEERFKNKLQGVGKKVQNPKELSLLIKKKLDIDLNEIKNISGYNSRKKVLKYLIQKAEDCGIFVAKTVSYHNIEVSDMRGLYIANKYCPFIVLNRRDAVSAQIFSFIHELTHLFRKTEAISNSLEFRKVDNNLNQEEILCNQVAVELLLPEEDFNKTYYNKKDIDHFSEIYKVSPIAIFYRLKDLNKIEKDKSDEIEELIKKEIKENLEKKKRKKKKGGDYTNSMKDSNGGLFNRIVSNYHFENQIGYTEASNILKFSVESV
jgi:Zn-dependent peptidase ImmA (M78 family)